MISRILKNTKKLKHFINIKSNYTKIYWKHLTTSSGSSASIRSLAGRLRDCKSIDAACAIFRLIACFVASATRSASNKASTEPSWIGLIFAGSTCNKQSPSTRDYYLLVLSQRINQGDSISTSHESTHIRDYNTMSNPKP